MKLIEPREEYWPSFWKLVEENKKAGIYSWFKEKNWKEYKKRLAREDKQVWWLVDRGGVVGRVGIRKEDKGRGEIFYNIRPSFRGKGYGKLILGIRIDRL